MYEVYTVKDIFVFRTGNFEAAKYEVGKYGGSIKNTEGEVLFEISEEKKAKIVSENYIKGQMSIYDYPECIPDNHNANNKWFEDNKAFIGNKVNKIMEGGEIVC